MPAKTKAKSLDEFAADVPESTKRARWIEALSEFDEIVAAYRNGIGPRVIFEWLLQEKGYTADALRGYDRFRNALKYAAAS